MCVEYSFPSYWSFLMPLQQTTFENIVAKGEICCRFVECGKVLDQFAHPCCLIQRQTVHQKFRSPFPQTDTFWHHCSGWLVPQLYFHFPPDVFKGICCRFDVFRKASETVLQPMQNKIRLQGFTDLFGSSRIEEFFLVGFPRTWTMWNAL